MTKVITRFPPSPTGPFHIGNVRTALYNFLFARHSKGEMVFRSEDTDLVRSKPEYEKGILDGLSWLGIEYDNKGEVIRQSERTEIYREYLQKIIDGGHAYISKEESKNEPGREVEVIRFKNPNKVVKFHDEIRGDIEVDTTDLGDFVIARNLNEPLYHLSVVIDDYLMGVTHIMRGDDGISNTPRQILIQEAIGAPRPIYAHLPLVLAPDRSKLSKRKHGESVSLEFYRKAGYLPEALVNFLALLGWNPGTDEEIFSMDELIERFEITKVQKGGAIFNVEKLNWFNKEHLKRKPWDEVKSEIKMRLKLPEDMSERLAPTVFERINTYGDVDTLVQNGEFSYCNNDPEVKKGEIVWKKSDKGASGTAAYLTDIIQLLEKIPDDEFTVDIIKESVFPYSEEKGRGEVLWPMRYSLSGKDKSPDPFTLAYILGKEKTIDRLRAAVRILGSNE